MVTTTTRPRALAIALSERLRHIPAVRSAGAVLRLVQDGRASTVVYDFGPMTLTLTPAYWRRYVFQSTDSTEALQNINNLTTFHAEPVSGDDPTTQDSFELRFASNGTGHVAVAGRRLRRRSAFGIYHLQRGARRSPRRLTCGFPSPDQSRSAATVPRASSTIPTACCAIRTPSLPPYASGDAANPNGVIFNDNNPNIMKQIALFGEASYKILDDLKVTAGIRFFQLHDRQSRRPGRSRHGLARTRTTRYLECSQNGSAVLPKLNLSYTPTPGSDRCMARWPRARVPAA